MKRINKTLSKAIILSLIMTGVHTGGGTLFKNLCGMGQWFYN